MSPEQDLQDLDALIGAVLARAAEPLSFTAIMRALPVGKKPTQKVLKERLTARVQAKQSHLWKGETPRYWSVEEAVCARERILHALAAGSLRETQLKQRVGRNIRATTFKSALTALVTEQHVRKHPKLDKSQRFAIGNPDALDYLSRELEKVLQKLERKLHFGPEQLRAALRSYAGLGYADPEDRATLVERGSAEEVLAAMSRLNDQTRDGSLVSITALRTALVEQFADKTSFDQAVLELARQGKVQLQSHAWSTRLSDSEQQALIPNGQGGFFDAIGLRLE